jgi:hypothetical protein
MQLHISLLSVLLTACEFMLMWIPVKILAAQFAGQSSLADTIFTVL